MKSYLAIVRELLDAAKTELHLPQVAYELSHPSLEEHGDVSSNIALKTFPLLRSQGNTSFASPHALAQALCNRIPQNEIIAKAEAAAPGFINFRLSTQYLLDQANLVLSQQDDFGKNTLLKGKRIVVEYTDPNPFKEFHVGHLYSNTVGESIATLTEAAGAIVWRADYFGDVGMHVAKSVWGLLQKFNREGIDLDQLSRQPLKQRIEYFGQAYALGASEYEENEQAKEEMKSLNFLLFKAAQEVVLSEFEEEAQVNYDQFIKPSKYDYEQIQQLYKIGRTWSLEYFETIYAMLGTNFNGYYPESRTGEFGYGMVMDGLAKGIFEKGDGGAVIFPGEKHGMHNRVFINALGLPTYETKDFGNAVVKHKDFAYDQSIIVTGNEINEYFSVVLKAMKMYRPDLGEVTKHIGHGMVRLPEGKMSSRTGKILRGEWLIDEAKTKVKVILDQAGKVPAKERDELAETIGVGAVKYGLLKQSIGENIAFDFETSVSFEGNSGPYLLYTYARAGSVLKKRNGRWSSDNKPAIEAQKLSKIEFENTILSNQELAILRWLYRFPEVVMLAGQEFAPHYVCTYLYELAQRFNSFYNKHSILGKVGEDNEAQIEFRLMLTQATQQILHNGLLLLGIKPVENM